MLEVSKHNFEEEVLKASEPVVVDVWGPSCQPCLQLMPEVEVLADKYKDKVKVVKLNSAQNRRLCIDLKVMGLPTFLVYKEGEEVQRISGGEITIDEIERLIVDTFS